VSGPHKTLFVAPQPAGQGPGGGPPRPKSDQRDAADTSDVRRVLPAYVAALSGAAGLGIALFVGQPAEGQAGPGPLTPPHRKAKLTCAKCHGTTEQGTKAFGSKAKEACVDCHGPHPSTRAPHRRLAKEGTLGCTTCHTIHGPQSGVRLSEDGPAVRYTTWAEETIPELSFHAGRNVLVPTIPVKVCLGCHTSGDDDPLTRCLSHAGGGELEPTVCFDEHRRALPPEKAEPGAPQPAKGVCSDQHFEDRSFAWEAAREVVSRAPTALPSETSTSLGWLAPAAGLAALGYAGTAGAQALRRRRTKQKRDAAAPAVAPTQKKRLPIIDTSTCLGCYACVDACPYGVLEVERYVAVVARPEACCGLVLCEQKCPNGSLVVGEEGSLLERPRVSPSLEALDVPGLFLAGDVTGMPSSRTRSSRVRAPPTPRTQRSRRGRRRRERWTPASSGPVPQGSARPFACKSWGQTRSPSSKAGSRRASRTSRAASSSSTNPSTCRPPDSSGSRSPRRRSCSCSGCGSCDKRPCASSSGPA
jgi:NAD-dependent dihydropyrimidine dehydrogenase PreA subunit